MNRLAQIRARQAAIRSDLDALEAMEDAGDEEHTRMDSLLSEWDELTTEAEPLQARADRLLAVRSAMSEERNREQTDRNYGEGGASTRSADNSGADENANGRQSQRFGNGPELWTQTRRDPFENLDSVRAGTMSPREIRSRAAQVVEMYANRNDHWGLADDAAEHATHLIQKRGEGFGTAVSRQMLITGAPEYLRAFEGYLTDPGGYAARAALSLTSANGGYLVPFTLDPTIILTNAGSANPYRRIATIKTTATNNWNGVTSAGVNAEWTAEGTTASDLTPTVGNLVVTPQKADAYLFGSFEVLSDSDFASELPGLLADAKDRIEETAFAVGTGSGQPWGVVTRATSANRAGTAAAGPAAVDVYATMGALPARWRGPRARNVWIANLATINALRNIPAFTGAFTSIVNDNGPEPTMLGKPFLESTSILGVFTTGSKVLVFGDLSQYYIVDRIGMSIVYDPVVLSQTTARPTGQGAWYAFWRTGADVTTATAIRVFATLT